MDYTKNPLFFPSYAAFSHRLNFLAPTFQALAQKWLPVITDRETGNTTYIVDSCPIIPAKGPRSGHAKVSSELCEKVIIPLAKSGIMVYNFTLLLPGSLVIFRFQSPCSCLVRLYII